MNKTQIIKKIVGVKLKDYGFRFLKSRKYMSNIYQGGSWI